MIVAWANQAAKLDVRSPGAVGVDSKDSEGLEDAVTSPKLKL
jgi:hypothetical protein